jgi:hypothetical protein
VLIYAVRPENSQVECCDALLNKTFYANQSKINILETLQCHWSEEHTLIGNTLIHQYRNAQMTEALQINNFNLKSAHIMYSIINFLLICVYIFFFFGSNPLGALKLHYS